MVGEEILFDAVLEPNRPLRSGAMALVLGGVAFVGFLTAMLFVFRGGWPVAPFLGADVLLLSVAFLVCLRSARRRERLLLTRDALIIERLAANGRFRRETLNPYWLRVEHEDPERIGAELALVSRGRRWVVGGFLGAGERASLAAALRDALSRARNS